MRIPGPSSLFFLLYLLVLLPLGARRTSRSLQGESRGPAITRARYWRSAVVVQGFTLLLALFTGSTFGYEPFAFPGFRLSHALLAAGALAAFLLLREVSRRLTPEAELRALQVFRRAPRTRAELTLFLVALALASVAEELAYRGVGWAVLSYSLGTSWLPAVVLSAAFALAHWSQGLRSGGVLFCFALTLHALVAVTHTLVVAMVVHAAYDLVVGLGVRRKALAWDEAEGRAA